MSDTENMQKDQQRSGNNYTNDAVYNASNANIIPLEPKPKTYSSSVSTPLSRSVSSSAQVTNNTPQIVSFHRTELNEILNIYGFKVADGEWRDYAIDMLKEKAIFSIYRNSREVPLHCIEKNPKLARKQGLYSVTGANGRILKRGHDLKTVLQVLVKKPKLSVI